MPSRTPATTPPSNVWPQAVTTTLTGNAPSATEPNVNSSTSQVHSSPWERQSLTTLVFNSLVEDLPDFTATSLAASAVSRFEASSAPSNILCEPLSGIVDAHAPTTLCSRADPKSGDTQFAGFEAGQPNDRLSPFEVDLLLSMPVLPVEEEDRPPQKLPAFASHWDDFLWDVICNKFIQHCDQDATDNPFEPRPIFPGATAENANP